MSNERKRSNGRGKGRNNRKPNNRGRQYDKRAEALAAEKEESAKADLRGKTKARNDASWYGTDSVLMKDAASIPFANTAGLPYRVSSDYARGNEVNLPGIMSLPIVPTPGICDDWNSPVNVAIRAMYSYIRHANSGSKNYDAANLGMYLQAYDACVTYYAWMVRLYGTLRMVIPANRYTPENMCTVMRADYNSLVKNMAQFRAYINTYAARLFQMKVPSEWHVMERHMWMYSNIFADSNTPKAQFFVFTPYLFWKYELGETPETTGLFPHWVAPDTDDLAAYDDIVTFGDELLNSVLNDEDFNIMSGDIIKAYGDKVFTLAMISEDYFVSPIVEPEALMQIHNATMVYLDDRINDFALPEWSIVEDYRESEDVGALRMFMHVPTVFNDNSLSNLVFPKYLLSNAALALKSPLDMPVSNPDPALVCLATRLKTTAIPSEDEDDMIITSYGTEIIVSPAVYKRDSGFSLVKETYLDTTRNVDVFDFRPLLVAIDKPSIGSNLRQLVKREGDFITITSEIYLSGQVDNLTLMSSDTVYNIHRAALMGMYGLTK